MKVGVQRGIMITINGLEQCFGKRQLFTQTDSMNIGKGINYLIGANGTGKTTFLKILIGIILPTSGTVKYENSSIAETLKNIGVVFDQPYFYPYLTGLENLYFFNDCSDYKVSHQEIKQLFDQWNVADEKTKYKNYSLGMKKKLSIVLSLVKSPDFWLLDEPFNALDIDIQRTLTNKLRQMKKDGKTVILSAHNIGDNIEIIDHVIAIDRGLIGYYPNMASRLKNIFTHTIEVEQMNMLPSVIADYVRSQNTVRDMTDLVVNTRYKDLVLELLKKANIRVIDDYPNDNTLSAFLKELEMNNND